MSNVCAGNKKNKCFQQIDLNTNEIVYCHACSAHRNDLENILPGFLIGLVYVLINPAAGFATLLFRVAAIARIAHTIVYAIVVVPQPARVLSFAIHYFICIYMGVTVFLQLL